MTKTVHPLFNLRIRSMEPKDFSFIRSLAAELPAFTVPSEYILWFFAHFHPDYCRVLEEESGNLKAYLLAMPTSNPPNGVAIWQVGATSPDRTFALEYFAAYLRELMERTGAAILSFTTRQDSASLRLIRMLSKQFGECDVVQLDSVPAKQGEHEFRLSIGGRDLGSRPDVRRTSRAIGEARSSRRIES
jgi:hypothetical protein